MNIMPQITTKPFARVMGMLAITALLTGCASTQPQPPVEGLTLSDTSPDKVRQSGATGEIVRWGGTIAAIDNLEDGSTTLQLVSRPLQKNGRPIRNDKTEGRFIAETTDFLDPAIVEVGRDLTLVGTVVDVREGKVGEANYEFPVVAVNDYQYWNVRNNASPAYYRYRNGFSPFGYDPFFRDPFFRHSPFRGHHRRSGFSSSLFFSTR